MSNANQTPASTSIAHYYDGWEKHNQLIARVIAPLTPEQLLLAPAPNMWPVSVLAAHIVAARVFWFHAVMREGPAELAPLQKLDDGPESERTVANLLAGLAATWGMIDGILARSNAENIDETFKRVYPDRVRIVTRQWVIWHVLEHDIHHAGEISQTLGMYGLTGLDM